MLREQKKEGRRRALIHAAETLIRESGSTGFSMQLLAETAGLSPATTYNLIGSKATVLYILLNKCMDRVAMAGLSSTPDGDPFERVLQAADAAVEIYTADPNFYRPLLRFLLGVPDPVHRPAFMSRAFRYWRETVQGLLDAGCLTSGIAANDLARGCQVFFAGAIDFWVHDELDGLQFRAQIRQGIGTMLAAVADKRVQPRIIREIGLVRPVVEPLYAGETDGQEAPELKAGE